MTETKDFQKVHKTTYIVAWHWDNGHDVFAAYGPRKETSVLVTARRWAARTIPTTRPTEDGNWWVRIDKGTYEDSSFDDHGGHGHVRDATWEPDPEFYCVGTVNNGEIGWDQG